MHNEHIEWWEHHHVFNAEKKAVEKRTLIVVMITFVMMAAEIFFGWLTNSMALFADGWHMGTHAFALGISLAAYILARRYAADKTFAFGAWKIEILGAYTSAIVLGLVGFFMIYSSVERLVAPLPIHYNQALLVAVLGLAVNVVCAAILNTGAPSHDHSPSHGHPHEGSHEDLNQKSAYLHVLADALTSVLAIIALLGAKYFNFNQLDPVMGIVGAILILHWAVRLISATAKILLQREMDSPVAAEVRQIIEADGDSKVSDLHIWQVAQNQYACIVSLVTGKGCTIDDYKTRLKDVHELAHVTVEIYPCREGN
ncbi:MAG: CDF family Co(II)/Ni(II) efflux transporter DmeF [Deltaproteobacteria bacterium]|jgi:cation diffusion facilitator family transporter